MYARAVLIVLSALLTSGGVVFAAPENPLSKSVQGVGVVTAIDPKAQRPRSTTKTSRGSWERCGDGVPVARPGLLTGIRAGDKIRFVINRRKGLIVGLKVTARAP